MFDDVYKKQLEQFGIESVRATEGDVERYKREETRKALAAVFKDLMSTMAGRQWMYSFLDMCQTFTAPFVPGKPDLSAFSAGIQSVGLKLFRDIMQASPENFYVMLQEEQARKTVVEEPEA